MVRLAAAPTIATVRVSSPHRILVISRRAGWGGVTSRSVNSESAEVRALLPGNAGSLAVQTIQPAESSRVSCALGGREATCGWNLA